MKTKILSILALLLMTVTQGAWAQETLTVYDGKGTSQYIPMYGIYFDSYTKSECIIPASELTAMKGGTITAITFYAKSVGGTNSTFGSANQKVFLKEVSGTTLGSYSGMTGATVVFDGTLPMPTTSASGYTITFSQGYTYNGGNLLIGVYNDAKDKYNDVTWYGNNNQSDRVSAYGADPNDLANVGLNAQSFLPKTTFTYNPAPTAIDLGLPSGTRWADMNVGAGSETGYGTYFAWAATASQADYSQANAPYYSGSAYTKYTGSDYTMLQRGDDAATVNWGSNWRMPTDTELQELIDNTTKEWKTNYNGTGVNGYLVTSKTNGNSIFLPAAGWYNGTVLQSASLGGNYWMSTVVTSNVSCGYSLNFYSTGYAPYKDNTDTRYVGFSVRPVQMFAGEGTQASPYLIASTTDWNNLVSAVNAGETYSGNYFKMTANVDASKMIGSSTETFKGNFDGDGYTLNLNINMTSSSSQIAAPFAYVVGGTIKNVKLTGTVSTAGMRSSSLIGYADNCTIRNCTSSVAISSSRNNDVDGGAFVACVIANKTVTIEGCAFTGSITFSDAAGYEGGGFVGWMRSPSTVTLTDCLFAPSAVSLAKASPAFKMFAYDNSGTTLTLNNCYYNDVAAAESKITVQGLQARSIAKGANVTTLAISGAGTEYDVSGITAYAHGIKYNDVYYASNSDAVSLTLAAESRDGYRFKQYTTTGGTITAQTETSASLTMPDANVTISAEYDPFSGGTGTSVNPYQIASTADWNLLVSNVNGGETYSGNYFKMTANVGTVSTWMTGTFSGTFDGDGKTLTVDYDASTEGCAPFGTLNGATIQKLKVAGSISSNQKLVAGIAALCSSTGNSVTNCLVSATINSSYNDNAADGGLVAVVDNGASLNVTGCAFAGKLLTTNGTISCGGIVGWRRPSGTVTITNCLYAPTSATGSETWIASAEGENGNANFCRWNSSEPTITNCYYTTDFGSGDYTAQGIQARTIAAGDYVSALSVTKGAATKTYDVSGITVYSGGIDFNDGSTTTFYGGSGQTVSLDLTAETRTGYQFKQYAASQGTLSGQTTNTPTLTMPAANSTANDVVTISAEYDPLYNATFASGNDNNGWTIDPTSGVAGTSVTVSYSGENKVKSVTVTKLALCSLSEVTSEHVGKIIGADGNVYASLAQAEKVTSAVGVLGKVTETGHGLIMSLEDAPQQVWATIDGWASASYAGTTLKVLPDDDARGSNLPSYTTLGSTTVSNWAVATRADYTAIFTNLGSTRTDGDGITYDEHVNAYITGAGGTAISGQNWSSTQYDSTQAWRFSYDNKWGARSKTDQYKVRPVLGF